MRVHLFLEAELHVGEAHRSERTHPFAAAEREHEVVESADLLELPGQSVRRGGIHRHDLRFGTELLLRRFEAGFAAAGDGDPSAGGEELLGGGETNAGRATDDDDVLL